MIQAPPFEYMKVVFENIGALMHYKHIYDLVHSKFGTVVLKTELDKLFTDTRGGTRQGFPPAVSEALIKIACANTEYLESIGHTFDTDVDEYKPTTWDIPKNF